MQKQMKMNQYPQVFSDAFANTDHEISLHPVITAIIIKETAFYKVINWQDSRVVISPNYCGTIWVCVCEEEFVFLIRIVKEEEPQTPNFQWKTLTRKIFNTFPYSWEYDQTPKEYRTFFALDYKFKFPHLFVINMAQPDEQRNYGFYELLIKNRLSRNYERSEDLILQTTGGKCSYTYKSPVKTLDGLGIPWVLSINKIVKKQLKLLTTKDALRLKLI